MEMIRTIKRTIWHTRRFIESLLEPIIKIIIIGFIAFFVIIFVNECTQDELFIEDLRQPPDCTLLDIEFDYDCKNSNGTKVGEGHHIANKVNLWEFSKRMHMIGDNVCPQDSTMIEYNVRNLGCLN